MSSSGPVTLPAAETRAGCAEDPGWTAEAVLGSDGAPGTTSILIADDTAVLRSILRTTLEHVDGWEVVGEARDGLEVLATALRLEPQVVVLDNEMPRRSGLAALPALRAACPDAVIVLWSGDEGAQSLAVRAGADAFVLKEPSLDGLCSTLTGLLAAHGTAAVRTATG